MIVAARPDVYNHNLETVPRLYPTIRPGARYYASIRLLETVNKLDPSIFTKSGVMLGLGEERLEVHQVMDDMRSADIDFLTMGQYLQPTPRHAKVQDFGTPAAVDAYAAVRMAEVWSLFGAAKTSANEVHAAVEAEVGMTATGDPSAVAVSRQARAGWTADPAPHRGGSPRAPRCAGGRAA